MGIYLASQLLIEPGDVVAVGIPNYTAADVTFRLCGAELLQVPIDENGMDVQFLEQILQAKKIKAVYVIPQHHFPTTVTMSMERRRKLIELARIHAFAIIEDDFGFDFHYGDEYYLPLISMDQNQSVIYIGSFSKTFAPALRIGFLAGPPKFVDAAAALRKYIDIQGDTLFEEAFASLFEAGEIDRHFRKATKIYKERRNLCCEILAAEFGNLIAFDIPEGGLAVWSRFEKTDDLIKVPVRAMAKGLHISTDNFHKDGFSATSGLRIGFASLEQDEMIQAFDILKTSLI
jgi:GntR family transcriptional regulator/MocR family aminotransferase